jgi:two-component system LytT family response regulator
MANKLTSIIVDDERLSRKELRLLLSEIDDIEVVGEADSVATAIAVIEQTHPDIIFLDIQLAGESGFDLIDRIDLRSKIIFVTAYDEFALRAFEINALDYLLKPVALTRLRLAINRLSDETKESTIPNKNLNLNDRLFIQFANRFTFLRVKAITHILSKGDYSEVFLNDGTNGLTNKTMQEWEDRLPQNYFCRIHRSTIINLDSVVKVEEWFNTSFRVYLNGVNEPFTMSRRYASIIRSRMG